MDNRIEVNILMSSYVNILSGFTSICVIKQIIFKCIFLRLEDKFCIEEAKK